MLYVGAGGARSTNQKSVFSAGVTHIWFCKKYSYTGGAYTASYKVCFNFKTVMVTDT